ncbi:MAG: putative selenium-dependent hydroxylase accessory protein YqeC, partial [Anaerolineaceae bacterium]|nr:putative selenium-dependent hydroxylase accessory protein YqeC [Anaerolineaceae bacterium]
KAPAKFEPAIPPWVDMVVNVVGLSGLGKPFSAETVHRHEEFASLSGLSMLNPITPEALTKVLSHGEGGLKNIPSRARKVIVLNQADTQEINVIEGMAAQLKEVYDAVLICALNSTNSQEEVLSVHELIGGIILAAGSSTRMGIPKILLEWKEQTLIRTIAEKALQGGLLPVIVVAGELIVQVVRSLEGLPVKLIENKQWHEGQSVSIVKGLQAVGRRVGGAIFLLADQPQIPVALIEELVKQHSFSLSPIIAPRVAGKRANPVLFDAVTFPALLKLIGDSGGRQIFDQFPPDWLEWSDDTILLDVDTPADYQQLKNLGSP